MNENFYVYPALLGFDVPGDVGIVFPDLPGCTGQCKLDFNVMAYVQETLIFHLSSMIQDGEKIPLPSPIQSIKLDSDEGIIPVRINISQFGEFSRKAV